MQAPWSLNWIGFCDLRVLYHCNWGLRKDPPGLQPSASLETRWAHRSRPPCAFMQGLCTGISGARLWKLTSRSLGAAPWLARQLLAYRGAAAAGGGQRLAAMTLPQQGGAQHQQQSAAAAGQRMSTWDGAPPQYLPQPQLL